MPSSGKTDGITPSERATSDFDKGTSKSPFLLATAAPSPTAAAATPTAAPAPTAKPLWRFTIIAGITTATANYYGGFSAASQMILDQMWKVNRLFNAPSVFKGTLKFEVTRIYYFNGPSGPELQRAHPDHDFIVVYDGYPPSTGGWHREVQGIHHYWGVSQSGGVFASDATDGLTHEFGHARGAIHLYSLRVEAANNPINGQAFRPVPSIMGETGLGVHVWDDHSVNLINKTASQVNPPIAYIIDEFPAHFEVAVLSSTGSPLSNAQVRIYPVEWDSLSVLPTAVASGSTNSAGAYPLASNPFGPRTTGSPWEIRYCNFLVVATFGGRNGSVWMPLYDVQNWAFQHGQTSTFPLKIVM
jgi:hypothetical protein